MCGTQSGRLAERPPTAARGSQASAVRTRFPASTTGASAAALALYCRIAAGRRQDIWSSTTVGKLSGARSRSAGRAGRRCGGGFCHGRRLRVWSLHEQYSGRAFLNASRQLRWWRPEDCADVAADMSIAFTWASPHHPLAFMPKLTLGSSRSRAVRRTPASTSSQSQTTRRRASLGGINPRHHAHWRVLHRNRPIGTTLPAASGQPSGSRSKLAHIASQRPALAGRALARKARGHCAPAPRVWELEKVAIDSSDDGDGGGNAEQAAVCR
jgi:hypothetical protein